MDERRTFFEKVFTENLWGSSTSRSGHGSELSTTLHLRQELVPVLKYFGIKSLLDAPCGDFYWMQHVPLDGIDYIGGDIVASIVESNQAQFGGSGKRFICLDIVNDDLPDVDVIFCRDCFIHFNNALVFECLENICKSNIRFLMVTHDNSLYRYMANQNQNIDLERTNAAGVNHEFRPLNFLLSPFLFPSPLHIINEGSADPARTMALWSTDQLREVLAQRRS